MGINKGKKWEGLVKLQYSLTFPDSFPIQRLYDQVNGHKTVSENPADYYFLNNGKLVYLECKETEENTLNFNNFPQLDRLLKLSKFDSVYGYVIIWYSKLNRVLLISDNEANKIRSDGNKSINIKMADNSKYDIHELSVVLKRTNPSFDFNQIISFIDEDIKKGN